MFNCFISVTVYGLNQGKTTTINMLTGLFAPDASSGNTSIYSNDIKTSMSEARKSIGVCPQHDVLFRSLTTREHIIFYALLKGGASSWKQAAKEADELLEQFHLTERSSHLGDELSGGMKRKVSTAVALCGNSKFVILDEPTAGMDPLARRELWDLLKEMRKGRTMLLTTHYMDEADVLGDRIGIMSRGELQCLGSSSFLKHNFGTGYKVICTVEQGVLATKQEVGGGAAGTDGTIAMTNLGSSSLENHELVKRILTYIQGFIEDASFAKAESSAATLVFVLPFSAVKSFKAFFTDFEAQLSGFQIIGFGVSITSLEEVFLKVGGDHDLEEFAATSADKEQTSRSLEGAHGEPSLRTQVYGLWWKRIGTSLVDFKRTVPLLCFPVGCVIAAWVLNYQGQFGNAGSLSANLAACIIAACGYFPVVSLICEAIVDERAKKLRNVLTVMGCDVRSYWLGSLAGDFTLVMATNLAAFIVMLVISQLGDPGDDWKDDEPLEPFVVGAKVLWLFIASAFQLCGFSYIVSFMFNSSGSAIVFTLCLCLSLVFLPFILPGVVYYGLYSSGFIGGYVGFFNNVLRIMAILSPQVALTQGLLMSGGACQGIPKYDGFYSTCVLMPYWAYLLIMLLEGGLYLFLAYQVDLQNVVPLAEQAFVMNDATVQQLDDDVRQEREHVEATAPTEFALHIRNLRKLFAAKKAGDPPLQAVKSLNLGIARGEIFGLLGANGAGKTTAISMIMRALYPTAGDVHIEGKSVLSNFQAGAKHLGIVAQHNTLWDKMTCRDHLRLFARLRGVEIASTEALVNSIVQDMELGPYADRLAGQLSGGMKRKLCVAIAIIGDPDVVLLDEPSAGLDPVSRRNLWDTLIKTMAKRAVIITTHSMEEAEALCTRIGIMVKGQLRALGELQHLKHKFGSGYEIILQLKPGPEDGYEARVQQVKDFLEALYPDVSLLSNNGGLLTFRLPGERFNVGLAFDALETNREALGISDYTVAQPTLEQVFVRTVYEYSGGERKDAFAASLHPDQSPWVRPTLGADGEPSVSEVEVEDSLNRPSALTPTRQSSLSASGSIAGGASKMAAEMTARGSMMLDEDDMNTSTGLRDYWLLLDRRSLRCLGCSMGWLMLVLYIYLELGYGFVIFNFILAFFICMAGCIGCCCVIPHNPDDDDDN
jgi:ATP-binding cassette subfamily A (ABC1) protein 3